jgi:hypothetical protein
VALLELGLKAALDDNAVIADNAGHLKVPFPVARTNGNSPDARRAEAVGEFC